MSKVTTTLTQKSFLILLLLTLALFLGWRSFSPALAQTEATDVAGLAVELWPDYDEPSMLVLLTGILAPDTPLPATVTIPLPETAEINAVARVTVDDRLVDDIEFVVVGNSLTLITPDPQFHVEYYDPYVADGLDRSYVFEWLSLLSVAQLSLVVQEPLMSTSMTIDPEPVNTGATRGDGLQYSTLASRVVPAGELFTVSIAYTMSSPQLSAPALATGTGQVNPDLTPPPATSGSSDSFLGDINPLWILGIFAAAALAGLAFFLGRQQAVTHGRKPKPNRPAPAARPQAPSAAPKPTAPKQRTQQPAKTGPEATPPKAARFCHNCGQPAAPDDRFCSNCGTKLKVVS